MKVLQLTREYPPDIYGGAGVVVGHLSRALRDTMDVEVRCWGAANRDDGGIPVTTYAPWERMAKRDGGPLYAPALETLSIALAMARDETDADIVHAHTWYADMAAFWVRTLSRIPLVVTLHSMEPLRPWKEDQLGTGYDLSCWIEKTTVEAADRVFAVSAGMKADIEEHYDVDPEKVVVVHNGIDPDRYVFTEKRDVLARHGIADRYVLCVQVVLCAASPDTPELEERMKSAVAGRDNVKWIFEMLEIDDVIQLYSHAAVFACPSVYEPFGLINLEAMGCGTAVVASGVGGILEVVVDGETGLLVPPSSPGELSAALTKVLKDDDLARSMGAAGRRRVEEKFSWTSVARQTKELYAEAIEEVKAR